MFIKICSFNVDHTLAPDQLIEVCYNMDLACYVVLCNNKEMARAVTFDLAVSKMAQIIDELS